MKKFLVIYAATPETLKRWSTMTQEEGQKEMEEWMVWQNANAANIVEPGNPAGKNTRLTAEGAQEVPNEICGYTVVAAESKEDAIKILSGNPHLKQEGTYIEVMNIVEM